MLLRNAVLYGSAGMVNIRITGGTITGIDSALFPRTGEEILELNGAVVYPGFINSHDHLDFNLYPRLGRGVYANYTEWGHDIHQKFTREIAAVKIIPEYLQLQWGAYKNLLNGFTSVVHHGKRIAADNLPVTVFQDCRSLHSVAFEKNWKWRLNNPFRRPVYVIHSGEGTDKKASGEISRLIRYNFLKKKIVAVHGVAMDEEQARSFSGLVWCPASNYFLLGKTARVEILKDKIPVVFGTDSTLTASWYLRDHLQAACQQGLVTENDLVQMLTTHAAGLWKLNHTGRIAEGKAADLTIMKGDVLMRSVLLAVIRNGEIMLKSEHLLSAGKPETGDKMSRILLNGEPLQVKGDLEKLITDITGFYPQAELPFELL
ncbi:MAG: amidohydrolase family protein [Chitinophagaceae bacterium]